MVVGIILSLVAVDVKMTGSGEGRKKQRVLNEFNVLHNIAI